MNVHELSIARYKHIQNSTSTADTLTLDHIQRWIESGYRIPKKEKIVDAIKNLFHEKPDLLPESDHLLIGELTIPFLAWGMTQPWSPNIHFNRAAAEWKKRLSSDKNTGRVVFNESSLAECLALKDELSNPCLYCSLFFGAMISW